MINGQCLFKKTLLDRLLCFVYFNGITLLVRDLYASSFQPIAPFCFLLPLPNCFIRVFTLFPAVLKLLLPLPTSAIPGAANSNKSGTLRVEAEMTLRGFAVPGINCASAASEFPHCRPLPF